MSPLSEVRSLARRRYCPPHDLGERVRARVGEDVFEQQSTPVGVRQGHPPVRVLIGGPRLILGADVTDPTALAQRIADLGQPLYGKAEPTGYSTTSDAWANSAGFLGRINFAGALAAGQIEGVKVDLAHLPGNGEAAARRLLGAAVSPATLTLLETRAAGKTLSPANIAAVVLASPDFQRR